MKFRDFLNLRQVVREIGRTIWKTCAAFNNDLYSVEKITLGWMICTTLYDWYRVELFIQRSIICSTALNYLYYVEWFVLRWMTCITLNDLYNVEPFFTSQKNLCNLKWFVQCWKICTTLNLLECEVSFVQRWIIWAMMNYWVSAF